MQFAKYWADWREKMLKFWTRSTSNHPTPVGKRIYAIGDVHGCSSKLDGLLALIADDANGADHTLIFLGDYVDRGPDSAGVIDRLISVQATHADAIFLKGNHEAYLLKFLTAPDDHVEWLNWGGSETLASYGIAGIASKSNDELATDFAAKLPDTHLAFMQQLTLYHRIDDHLFVHAGLKPGVSIKDQNENDLLWIRDRFHNALPHERPDVTVVHGHQRGRKPINLDWRVCVDTGACYDGKLTAVALHDNQRRFLQV